jgi:hypothetical protein
MRLTQRLQLTTVSGLRNDARSGEPGRDGDALVGAGTFKGR